MKTRHSILLFTSIVFLASFASIAIYLNFFMAPKIASTIEKNHRQLFQDLDDLTKEIQNTGDLKGTINIFSKDHNLIIDYDSIISHTMLKDYKQRYSDDYYHANAIIEYEGTLFVITAHTKIPARNTTVVTDSIIFSIIRITVVFIIVFWILNLQLISPIVRLQKSIKNYKFGIKPQKSEGKSETDAILNNFVELVEDLEKEKEKQNRIIASISHDIKTPLTAILGYSDRVVNVQLDRERRIEYLEKIHNKALALKDLTDEFDDYLSCNIKCTLKQEEIKLNDFLDALKKDYKDDLEEKNIKLVIESDLDEKTVITVDIAKIKRIFSNTISNSVRFIEKFGKITIKVKDKDPFIEFTVSDNGPGIDDEDNLKRIFEPLFTSDPSRKISGLGLAICKEIVENHGGKIYAQNNEDKGLSIIFTIKK